MCEDLPTADAGDEQDTDEESAEVVRIVNSESGKKYAHNFIVNSLNLNGWSDHNSTLRGNICSYKDADFICVSETHLEGEEFIQLEGYRYYGWNRACKRAENHIGGCRNSCQRDCVCTELYL